MYTKNNREKNNIEKSVAGFEPAKKNWVCNPAHLTTLSN